MSTPVITSTSAERYDCVVEVSDTAEGFRFRIRHVPSGNYSPWSGCTAAMIIDDPMHAVFAIFANPESARVLTPLNPAEFAELHRACGYSSHTKQE